MMEEPAAKVYQSERAVPARILHAAMLAIFDATSAAARARSVGAVQKARIVHTEDNSTVGMLERDPVLAERWRTATHKEISGGIIKGYRTLIADAEAKQDGWIEHPLVLVH
jgi:hypothetical protein